MAKAKSKVLRCECGGKFEEKLHSVDELETEAMVCPRCGHVTFTVEQAKRYSNLRHLQSLFAKERKVVKMGNSVGVTLPEGFAHRGQRVRMVPKDEHTIELRIR